MPKLTNKEKSNEHKDARAIGYESGWNDAQKYPPTTVNNVNARLGYADGIRSRAHHRKNVSRSQKVVQKFHFKGQH